MLGTYYPILVMGIVAGAIVVGMVVAARVLGPRKNDPVKLAAYECGMWPEGDARRRFAVKFYVVAMLFILFDVEAAFLYPWAVLYNHLRLFGIVEMAVFFTLLAAAYAYVWRAGGFEWD